MSIGTKNAARYLVSEDVNAIDRQLRESGWTAKEKALILLSVLGAVALAAAPEDRKEIGGMVARAQERLLP